MYSRLLSTEFSCWSHSPSCLDIVTIITESITQTNGTWHAVLDTASVFFAILLSPKSQKQFPFTLSGRRYTSAVCLQEYLNFPTSCH